jgi:putative tryptophan/tyrosine transport system substrate-binding protein
MDRRTFVGIVESGLLAHTYAAGAQQEGKLSEPRRVAWFGSGRGGVPSPFFDSFLASMRESGWIEGQNLALRAFFTHGSVENADHLARQMLATGPEVIVVHGRDVGAVHRAKPTGPVAFAFSGNPVDAGFVESLARPGTNFTGVTFMSLELAGKRIELLRELAPQIRRLAVLARPEHPGEHRERAATEEVVNKLGIALAYVPIRLASELDGALQEIKRRNCDALIAFPDGVTLDSSGRIASYATQQGIATVSGWGSFADNGFLLSYGPNLHDSYRRLARYVDRILRGDKPQELPVELPRSVELVLNMRTARSLGLAIPKSVLLRADRVIE